VYGDPPVDTQEFLERRGVSIFSLANTDGDLQQSAAALKLIAAHDPSVVYFVAIKLGVRMILAKVLTPSIALVDTQPPSDLHKELTGCKDLQHRICMDGSEYYARLHATCQATLAVKRAGELHERKNQSAI
jgi:hypothetical protein